jgi:deazaflavin-dependent oxidoreductase (nitroreductase family)
MRWLLHMPVTFYRLGLGAVLDSIHLMVLTTWGRSSKLPRHSALEYRAHGSKVYIVAAWGKRSQWYRNLKAQPVVRVSRGWHSYSAEAVDVTDPHEALRALHLFRNTSPMIYDNVLAYLSQREKVNSRVLNEIARDFTIVRLDPSDTSPGPPAIKADLVWLWPLVALALLIPLLGGLRAGKRS